MKKILGFLILLLVFSSQASAGRVDLSSAISDSANNQGALSKGLRIKAHHTPEKDALSRKEKIVYRESASQVENIVAQPPAGVDEAPPAKKNSNEEQGMNKIFNEMDGVK